MVFWNESIGPLKTSVYEVQNSKGSVKDRFSGRVIKKDKTMQCTVVISNVLWKREYREYFTRTRAVDKNFLKRKVKRDGQAFFVLAGHMAEVP